MPPSECPVPPGRIPTGGRGLGYAQGPLTRDWPFSCGRRVPVTGGAGGFAGADAPAQTKARGAPSPDPRTHPGPEARAPSAPAPSLFSSNKFLAQIGGWIRLVACWQCVEKNLVSGRKHKLSKGELVELSWNVTFVADGRMEPRPMTASDSPGDPLVLVLDSQTGGDEVSPSPSLLLGDLRRRIPGLISYSLPFFPLENVCLSAHVVGVLSKSQMPLSWDPV